MLYVFYVDVGRRMTFDMALLNESVRHLKNAIEQYCSIPVNKQVLLISGGECLQDHQKVCSYSSGTDTNPIFLFNKAFLEQPDGPWISSDYRMIHATDNELHQMYDAVCSASPPITIFTIHKVHQLAQKYYEQAADMFMLYGDVNVEELLQQQGWSAAVANLDDLLNSFRSQCEAFDAMYTKYLETRQESIALVNRFSNDLDLLSRIPILPALLDVNEEERARVEFICDKSSGSGISLLDWISAKDPEQSLENVVRNCQAALEQYSEEALEALRTDIGVMFCDNKIKDLHDNTEINEKLMMLGNLIHTIKRTHDEQMNAASGIRRNHDRAIDENDDSVLPDLFAGHKSSIQFMKANHINLRSCRQLCIQSKSEFCEIINLKLRTVMEIQEKVAEIRTMLILHSGNLKRLKHYLEIIQTLQETPQNYFKAISEVVRRRSYSQAFLMWASDLACRIFNIYTEETDRRKKFQEQFKDHFLNCLFPGMDDMPPSYATQSPPLFDNNLPTLCKDDLQQLCQCVNGYDLDIDIPDVESIRRFFLSKSLTLSTDDEDEQHLVSSTVEDKLVVTLPVDIDADASDDVQLMSMCQKTDSDCANGNDGDVQNISTKHDIADVELNNNSDDLKKSDALNASKGQDNKMDIVEHEKQLKKLRDGMAMLGTVAHNTVISLRNDLSFVRDWALSHQSNAVTAIQKLYSQNQALQYRMRCLLQAIDEKDDKMKSLFVKISCLETELNEQYEKCADKSEDAVARFQEELQKERERITKEVTERLVRDHKKELDSLRSRFKLMTCAAGMERTSSDTSLEKVDRGELIELANHESILARLKDDAKVQLEKALSDQRLEYDVKLADQLRKFEDDKQMFAERIKTQILRECDRQIDIFKNKEESLLCEIQKHKETIHMLTTAEAGNYSLLNRISELEREKSRLEAELIKERASKYSFSQLPSPSPATCTSNFTYSTPESSGSSTSLGGNSSPELPMSRARCKDIVACKKSRASSLLSTPGRISISSCNIGDSVLVVWDEMQRNYTILQESSITHFLHPSSIDALGLKPASDGSPRRLYYCPAEVVEKEYCASRKTSNRYNMKEGERFYRVKVRSLLSVNQPTT